MNLGIDYGLGTTNINTETGIHYGVIPQRELQWFFDSAEADYGKASCPKCGEEAVDASNLTEEQEEAYEHEHGFSDYACHNCEYVFDSQEAFPEEANGYTIDDGEYKMEIDGDCIDVFITLSPYFTYAQFCSPCAPGACYLTNYLLVPDLLQVGYANNRAYCPGLDWFDNDTPCPYPVYSVETGECLYMPIPQEN